MTPTTVGSGGPRATTSGGSPRQRAGAPVLVVAAAGYGKTAWVEAAAPGARVLRADDDAVDRATDAWRDHDGRLVVEDLHLLAGPDQLALLSGLGRLARDSPTASLVLTSRALLDPKTSSALPGPVVEVGPAELRLGTPAVAALLEEEHGLTDPELPTRVHAATAGWVTLVHLAAEALLRDAGVDLVEALGAPGTPAATWLGSEVVDALTDDDLSVLADVADLDLLTPDLVGAVGGDTGAFARLVRLGILVPHPRSELLGRAGHRVVPVVARMLAEERRDSTRAASRQRSAAEWYEQHDLPFAALASWLRAGDTTRSDHLLAEQGPRMVAQGDADGLVAVLSRRPPDGLTPGARRTLAEALNHRGDAYAALGAFAPLVRSADDAGWDAGLAAAVAAVHFSQGEIPRAGEVLDRVPRSWVGDDGPGVVWRATRANVASMLGDEALAAELAAEALRIAEGTGDPVDLAAAHQAVAKTSAGSRKAAHLGLALTAARQGGDAVSLARILGNQSYALLAAARCAEAVAVSRQAVRATELVRPRGALTAALHNLAEALCRTGQYAEARWHLRRAAAVSQRLGVNRAAASLCGLGDAHRALGQREQGRTAYEEAIRLARESQELQVLVPALAGLARLVADVAPDDARAHAEEAFRLRTPGLAPYALIAVGWVEALSGGAEGRRRAADLAVEAAATARAEQSLDLLAEALELSAEVAVDPDAARDALQEAHSIWREGGADPDAARIEVLLGRLEGADPGARSRAREAAERLQRLGLTAVNGRDLGPDPAGKEVAIVVLGRFDVVVAGRPVVLTAWRSRQARTLVKVLAARQGAPISRATLCELLWPESDPLKTAHRLSVLLATVRTVLDPAKAWPSDRYVCADGWGVWLDPRRVGIDVDDLLAEAEHGAALLAADDVAGAAEVLAAVDARYRGDAFVDEPDEEWAAVVREQARGAWLRSLRHLATIATQQGRSNDAAAILTRLLGIDPYDERVHQGLVRTLVRAGRHGEARRAFDRWTEAMESVDVAPPDPSVLSASPPRRPL